MPTAAVLRVCFLNESRRGKAKWLALGWCGFFGLLGLATGSSALASAAAVPAVPAALAMLLTWSWERLVQPFIEGGSPKLRLPAMALLACFWLGGFACWLAAHQSRCATHRSATREGCSEDWRQRAHPLRHRPAAAPDLGVLVVSWRARRWDARADA